MADLSEFQRRTYYALSAIMLNADGTFPEFFTARIWREGEDGGCWYGRVDTWLDSEIGPGEQPPRLSVIDYSAEGLEAAFLLEFDADPKTGKPDARPSRRIDVIMHDGLNGVGSARAIDASVAPQNCRVRVTRIIPAWNSYDSVAEDLAAIGRDAVCQDDLMSWRKSSPVIRGAFHPHPTEVPDAAAANLTGDPLVDEPLWRLVKFGRQRRTPDPRDAMDVTSTVHRHGSWRPFVRADYEAFCAQIGQPATLAGLMEPIQDDQGWHGGGYLVALDDDTIGITEGLVRLFIGRAKAT